MKFNTGMLGRERGIFGAGTGRPPAGAGQSAGADNGR